MFGMSDYLTYVHQLINTRLTESLIRNSQGQTHSSKDGRVWPIMAFLYSVIFLLIFVQPFETRVILQSNEYRGTVIYISPNIDQADWTNLERNIEVNKQVLTIITF